MPNEAADATKAAVLAAMEAGSHRENYANFLEANPEGSPCYLPFKQFKKVASKMRKSGAGSGAAAVQPKRKAKVGKKGKSKRGRSASGAAAAAGTAPAPTTTAATTSATSTATTSTPSLASLLSLEGAQKQMAATMLKQFMPNLPAEALENMSAREGGNEAVDALRRKYSLLDKVDWWFIMDETLAVVADQLKKNNFCVLDGFTTNAVAGKLRSELEKAKDDGLLEHGVLGGGRTGSNVSYTHDKVRGDLVGWFDTETPGFHWVEFPKYLKKADTFVAELSKVLPGMVGDVSNRSLAMATCYPGNGACYVKHCDNHCRSGDGENCNG